jgi:hypothetical protein
MQNVYEYFVQFQRAAKNAGWPQSRIDVVLDEARSGYYTDALAILLEAMEQMREEQEKIIS